MGEDAACGRVAFRGAVNELAAELHDAGAAEETFLARAAEEIRFHFHGDGAFLDADTSGDGQPHGDIRGGDEGDAGDDAVGARKLDAVGSAYDAGAAAGRFDAKAVEAVKGRGVEKLLERFG